MKLIFHDDFVNLDVIFGSNNLDVKLFSLWCHIPILMMFLFILISSSDFKQSWCRFLGLFLALCFQNACNLRFYSSSHYVEFIFTIIVIIINLVIVSLSCSSSIIIRWISCLRIDFGMGRTTVLLCSFEIPFKTWNKNGKGRSWSWLWLISPANIWESLMLGSSPSHLLLFWGSIIIVFFVITIIIMVIHDHHRLLYD